MSNLEKMTQMLENDPTLQDKVTAESKSLAENGVTDVMENLTHSVKKIMGLDLTEEETRLIIRCGQQQLAGETPGEGLLTEEELDNVVGGVDRKTVGWTLMGAFGGAILGAGVGLFLGGPVGGIVGVVGGGAAGGVLGATGYVEKGVTAAREWHKEEQEKNRHEKPTILDVLVDKTL